jgi:rhomboid protease GluP
MTDVTDLIVGTWLTRKPHPWSFVIAAAATLVLVIGSMIYLHNLGGFADLIPANRDLIFQKGQVWRLWTTLFAHADERHLLSNSLLFFILGSFLMGYFGLLAFPLSAILFGGITNALVLAGMPEQTMLIGMSGVVFWLGGVWLILYFLIERRKSLFQRSLRALGVGLMLFFPAEAFDPSISYKTHFIGFLLGLLWGVTYFSFRRKFFRSQEVHRVVIEPPFEEDTDISAI